MSESSRSLSETLSEIYQIRSRFGLRRRSVLAVSGLVGLVLVAQISVLAYFGHKHLVADARKQARSFAKLAVDPICDAYLTYHDSGASKFRDLVRENVELHSDLLTLEIFDTEGRRLYAYDRVGGERAPEIQGFFLDGRLLSAVQGLETVSWDDEKGGPSAGGPSADSNGRTDFVVAQPHVEDWGRHRLTVVFGFGERFVQRAALELSKWLAILALLGLVLGVVCAYALANQSLRPLERLIRGARVLSRGNLKHRIRLDSGDEFEVLGATLDHMAELLSVTVHDLESSNQRLEKINAELQELDKVKSDLLANVSHELRTPLTAISGYVEALSTGLLGDVSSVQRDSLKVVDRNVQRLRGMIDQLLSYSRLDSGRMELDMRPFDLAAVARHVGEAVAAARGDDLTLRLQIEDGIPEAYGDGSRISQVLENLLTNAAKFSPAHKPVDLVVKETHAGLVVEVVDRGIGIPEEHLGRIFDRFYQVDATSRRQFGGMGLGLAIVKEILEMHHCEVEVESAPGHGTTFRFVLPRSTERTGLIPVVGARSVLLIDDDAPAVQSLTGPLVAGGWTVMTAATAEQGSSLARRERPDIILLDRLLPDLDGFDLVPRLQEDERTKDIPIVIYTVRPERALGLRLGVTDYWIKPVEAEEIQRRLERLVGRPSGVLRQESEKTERE